MSEKTRNARKLSNVFAPQNRNKLYIIGGVAAAVLAYGIYLNSGGDPEQYAPQMQSNIKETKVEAKEDKLGQTQLTNQTRMLEYQLNKQKVEDQVYSGESAIMERKNELNPIAYQPKQKLEAVELPKVETPEIEVKQVQETTEVRVEPQKEVQVVESYRAPSYAQVNRQSIEALKAKMNAAPYLREENTNQQQPNAFNPTTFTYFGEYQADKVRESELAKRVEELKVQQQLAPVTTVSNGNYVPSTRAVNDDTAGFNQGLNNILFRAGQRVAAITLLKASSQQLGPILATIAEGEYAGAELMGTVSRGVDKLNFQFTSMWLPNEQIRVPVSAIALQFEDQTVGTQTDVDNRNFRRFFLKPILKGIGAAGQYYAQDEGTTVANNAGVVIETKGKRTANVARKVALGNIADNIASAIDELDTAQIVTQDQNTPIVVMFMNDVVATPEFKENTQKLESSIAEPREITPHESSKAELTREEALALQKTGMAQDPKVQAEIIKTLATSK